MESNEIVYHYCSVEAFVEIIKNSKLWLSDILKSNDSNEGIWIRDRIVKDIKKRLLSIDTDCLEEWEKGYELNPEFLSSMYAICFSERKDCLSQWRGYAQDGQGIAIGFSKKYLDEIKLEHLEKPFKLKTFDKIIYDEKEQDDYIHKIVCENINSMDNNGIYHTALEFNTNFLMNFPLCKNPSFEEEQEWRVIIISHPRHQTTTSSGEFKFHAPKFRVTSGKIISYIEMDFSKIKNNFIKEIWIGPKSLVTKNDIQNILAVNGYYENAPYISVNAPILITNSESSYR